MNKTKHLVLAIILLPVMIFLTACSGSEASKKTAYSLASVKVGAAIIDFTDRECLAETLTLSGFEGSDEELEMMLDMAINAIDAIRITTQDDEFSIKINLNHLVEPILMSLFSITSEAKASNAESFGNGMPDTTPEETSEPQDISSDYIEILEELGIDLGKIPSAELSIVYKYKKTGDNINFLSPKGEIVTLPEGCSITNKNNAIIIKLDSSIIGQSISVTFNKVR